MSTRIIYILSALLFTACGKHHAEQARQKERIELEKRAQREMEAANKMVTEMNEKMFRKRPASKSADALAGKAQDSSKEGQK